MALTHGVLQPQQIAAMNTDSYNRNAVCMASDVDNGHVLVLGGKSTVDGESEVFLATQPVTGSLSGLWMAFEGWEVVTTDSKYRGLDPDPRNFYHEKEKVFSVFKPQLGDIILLSGTAIGGSFTAGTSTHINATNQKYALQWGASQTASVLSFKLLGVKYMSLATGKIDDQRIAAYQFECVGL